jgi:hypothetical protein
MIMEDKKGPINELHVNLLGKIFLAGIAAWMVGKATNLKIRGSKQEIDAVSNALLSSRRFQEEISKPGATVQSVMQKLGMKQLSAKEFERVLGVPWPC